MSNNKKNSAFLVQGSVLALASIVSRIIGLLYRVPMTNIIGEYGNDYYSCAFEIYSMMLLISSYSLPMAVSKMVSARMAKKEKQNAYRVFQGALLFAVVTGAAGMLIVFFGAQVLTEIFKTPLSYLALKVLAPTILIVAILGVIRGFFQGLGTMVPSAVSQILEQIVNAGVSVGAAYVLFNYGLRVAAVLGSEQHYAESYGAAGGTLGTSTGAFIALLFCLFIFLIYRTSLKRQIAREKRKGNVEVESFASIMKILILTVVPVLLSTALYNLVSIVDQGLFKNLAIMKGYDSETVSSWWGVYSGYYRVIINVPISISTALATSSVPALAAAFARKDMDSVRIRIGMALRFIMIVSLPCTVGMFVLADPIVHLLFGGAGDLAGKLIMAGAVSIVFYSISTLSNATLQGIDRMSIPIRNSVIALIINLISVFVCVNILDLQAYSVIVGNIVFSLVMCILNELSVIRYSKYRPEIGKIFVKPAIASVAMGVVVYAINLGLGKLPVPSRIVTVVAILVGMLAYAVVLLVIKGVTEEELKSFPKGRYLIRFGKKLHLL